MKKWSGKRPGVGRSTIRSGRKPPLRGKPQFDNRGLTLILHADPARSWTVENLAKIAGVSRSTFALRFKQKSGVTPLEYVLRWRMQLATRLLKTNHTTISSIAQKLGYDSDSAFSHAFKRIMTCSPREYRESSSISPQENRDQTII
uniref:helix-turn-helix transcriptional regulator n=1 Tax=Pseudomonas kilonensis TaxID=132476 RepID=UPI001F1F647E|nr:AraC family transcriptional regulator [Pseudomonas kilonensis]